MLISEFEKFRVNVPLGPRARLTLEYVYHMYITYYRNIRDSILRLDFVEKSTLKIKETAIFSSLKNVCYLISRLKQVESI